MPGKLERIDAPGVKIEGQLLNNMRREVASLLKRDRIGFPGAQPVSFVRSHLEELRQQDYYVCEKSDGIRYLMYLTDDENGGEIQYLIDRRNDYWLVPSQCLHFPVDSDELGFHTRTLVDGELVVDDLGNGETQPKFLVFDCLVLDGKVLMERTLDKRLAYFKEGVFKPYDALFKKYPQELPFQAFHMEMKDMQFSYGIEMMFREVLPRLRHGNDGLIFTCRNSEYRFGTDPHILKWKPVEENTVDFRIQLHFRKTVEPDEADLAEGVTEPWIDYDAVPDAELYTFLGGGDGGPNPRGMAAGGEGRYQYFADCYISEEDWEAMKSTGDPISNRVVECGRDEQGRWRVHRFRDDKPEANHINVMRSVMDSIRDSVSEQELKDAAKGIKDSWKMRAAAQHHKK